MLRGLVCLPVVVVLAVVWVIATALYEAFDYMKGVFSRE